MMNKILLLSLLTLLSCHNNKPEPAEQTKAFEEIKNKDYELVKSSNEKAVLILFGGYPEDIEDIKKEFKILQPAIMNQISVLYSSYNQKIWLEDNEKKELALSLQKVFIQKKLSTDNIHLGGFSSGGNIALLIGDYLSKNKEYQLSPKGIFIIDSPIDLAALYLNAEKNVANNFSIPSVQEGKWLIETLGDRFGHPNEDISKYQKSAVFTSQTANFDNIQNLKNAKLRLYTEPDTIWWKKNRMTDYEQMNAYYIKVLAQKLKEAGFSKTEYISTKNKGYRANGDRHPHSWSIVDKKDLINWILN